MLALGPAECQTHIGAALESVKSAVGLFNQNSDLNSATFSGSNGAPVCDRQDGLERELPQRMRVCPFRQQGAIQGLPVSTSDDLKRTPTTRQQSLESKDYLGEAGAPAGGSAGGELARKNGTKDEMKRSAEQPAGATRVRKSDETER